MFEIGTCVDYHVFDLGSAARRPCRWEIDADGSACAGNGFVTSAFRVPASQVQGELLGRRQRIHPDLALCLPAVLFRRFLLVERPLFRRTATMVLLHIELV